MPAASRRSRVQMLLKVNDLAVSEPDEKEIRDFTLDERTKVIGRVMNKERSDV